MTREEMIAIAEGRATGSQDAARHTHIECWCPDRAHRREEYDQGCFCPDCAADAAEALGYPRTDTEPEAEGADDLPQWCEKCDRLITLRSSQDLPWGITADAALKRLEHYETGLGSEKGEPKTADDWRVFLLLVDSIAVEHLPRVEAVIERATSVAARDLHCRRPTTPPA